MYIWLKAFTMLLSKNRFFLLLIAVFIVPFIAQKLIWLAGSKKTTGELYFIGHGDLGSALGISTYPVIRFEAGKDTIEFKGNINPGFKPGEKIPVRYQQNNPADARIDSFVAIWMSSLAYALLPALSLLVLYFIPERFDPVIPKGSKVLIGKRPFIKIIKD